MTLQECKEIIEDHEDILRTLKYPPPIVAELRYYRSRFLPTKLQQMLGVEIYRKPRHGDAT